MQAENPTLTPTLPLRLPLTSLPGRAAGGELAPRGDGAAARGGAQHAGGPAPGALPSYHATVT
eukprot:scaffold975_cov63-Phaeocystis_antarctica.AAC.17